MELDRETFRCLMRVRRIPKVRRKQLLREWDSLAQFYPDELHNLVDEVYSEGEAEEVTIVANPLLTDLDSYNAASDE